jgi:localization factor PodJL
MNGRGVPRNLEQAVNWYCLAANQGHASAQMNLGICLIEGMGAERDPAESCKWLTLAAGQGKSMAQEVIDRYFKDVSPEQIAEGKRRADLFQPKPPPPDEALSGAPRLPLQTVRPGRPTERAMPADAK